MLDEELIAAWKHKDGPTLARMLEEWVDAPVAAGVVEYSWREARETKFIPANEGVLSLLMTRYPDSTKSFFDDLIGAQERQPPDLAPPQAETACARASRNCVRLVANFQDYAGAGDDRVAAFHPSGNVTMPQILRKVPAEYSDEARNARRSGTVVLAATVDAAGKVTNAQVIESLGMTG